MLHHRQYTPPAIRSLIDHLDAARAACDALLCAHGPVAEPHNLLRLELTAIAHVLQAREDMRGLRIADRAIANQMALFLTVTGCLEEPAPASAAAGLEAAATRLIGGRIPVTTLMALTTAMRDVVGLCLGNFEDEAEESGHPPSTGISETLVWATGPGCT